MEIFRFLIEATIISLSGVMMPGPVTAATIAVAAHRRHAGAWIAVGHGVVELPLMLLILAGAGVLLESAFARAGIGLIGGAFLILTGVTTFHDSRRPEEAAGAARAGRPIVIGIVLTAGNPYFLLWWASVGLTLTTRARTLGVLAFALFAAIHWLCDLLWLEALSLTSFAGSRLLGGRRRRIMLIACAAAMAAFGAMFIWNAIWDAARALIVGSS